MYVPSTVVLKSVIDTFEGTCVKESNNILLYSLNLPPLLRSTLLAQSLIVFFLFIFNSVFFHYLFFCFGNFQNADGVFGNVDKDDVPSSLNEAPPGTVVACPSKCVFTARNFCCSKIFCFLRISNLATIC